MKKKLKCLIGLMSVCAVGAISGAFALTRVQGTATGSAGSADQALYLYWGGTNSELDLAACENIVPNVAQYRYFAVAPQWTKSVDGDLKVTFTLAAKTGKYHIKDLTVTVFADSTEISASNIATYDIETPTKKIAELDETHLTFTDTISIDAQTNTTGSVTKYYAVKVFYTADTFVSDATLDGTLTISQQFEATAE